MAADDYHIISKHGKTTNASVVSPNSAKKPKERVPAKPDMPQVNQYLMCQLCSGYLIDATSITECLHTFCKSCILKYLETNNYCPICDVQLNERAPTESLRSDVTMQKLVYKLVPGLLVSESRRRRDFYIKNGMESVEAAEMAANSLSREIEASSDLSTVLSLDDVVSLSIEYFRSNGDEKTSTATSFTIKSGEGIGKQSSIQSSQNHNHQPKSNAKSSSTNKSSGSGAGSNNNVINANNTSSTDNTNGDDSSSSNNTNEQANDRRYLQCPAAVSVGLLKKFIRRKYGLSDEYRVDLLYNGNRDSILENDLTLLDVAFVYKWHNKEDPMKFHYRIFEKPTKSVTVYSGMKRTAPSVMDEPPDDGSASGPHSRSSMYSSSSAPSSKLPRLGDNATNSQGNQGSMTKDNTSGKSRATSTTETTESSSSSSVSSASTSAASSATVEPSSKPTATTHSGKSNSASSSSSSAAVTTPTPTPTPLATIKIERSEVEEEDDDEDEEEDYELVERREHMKGIKTSRKHSIRESMKRSVAASNLRSHISRSSSSHSTEGKTNVELKRESGNENSLSNNNSSNNNSSASNKASNSAAVGKKGTTGTGRGRGRPPKNVESLRLRVTSTDNKNASISSEPTPTQSTGSLKMSISTSGITPVVSSSPAGGEKKEPLKLSLGSVLANNKGSKSPERKHHKHKHHHHHHKLRHRDKQSKSTSSSSSSSTSPSNQKPIKISFTLSPPGTATVQQGNQSQNSGATGKDSKSSGDIVAQIKSHSNDTAETKDQKGKQLTGNQNFNNSARTSSSAHGHLNNISKSISVSVNSNVNSKVQSNVGGPTNANKGNQYGNKTLSAAELIPKNTGIEIQPTTIPVSSHGPNSLSQSLQQSSSGSTNNNSSNSHKHSHPLLPDSVHVPKSVTLIPVNPNSMSLPGSANNKGSNNSSSSLEKGGSGSHQGNQNRINAHTFTHPITNKSLHQITVTEVPPPHKTSGIGGNSCSNSSLGNSSLGSNIVTSTSSSGISTTATHSSISGTTSNPIEKVIASAGNNKPQFNGPGSMEITKIYCGTTTTSKENPAKKLKDRRGLDISITGTGINVNVNKSAQKLEETLRQKVNIATGGGTSSISVTPVAPPPNTISTANSNVHSQNKMMKSVTPTAASLLSGKMPPGITIGPATVPHQNQNPSNNNSASNSNSNNMSSANVGNNIMKGLGFTLPPHLTAHPHNPNIVKNVSSQGKSDKMPTNNSRLMGKDSVTIIGKGTVGGQQQQPPPPVEITISATGGNKSQANITNRGINIVNKTKVGGNNDNNNPLASIFDITQGIRKSPSPAGNNHHGKDTVKVMNSIQTASINQAAAAASMNAKNMVNKRASYDMSASGNINNAVQNASGNKKTVKELTEMKRGRSASTSSESSTGTPSNNIKQPGKSGEVEIPLDLSGRSTRTTPPIIIPQIREPSKSPTVTSTTTALLANEKRATAANKNQTPEIEKSGNVISPSSSQTTSTNNFLSPKVNTHSLNQKNSSVESLNKGQNKFISVSKLSPNQTSKLGSIVDSLAQKQSQAQQQQQQNIQAAKKSPTAHQPSHHSHSSHPHHSLNVATSLASNMAPTQNTAAVATKGNASSNTGNSAKGSSSGGITSPITASSLTSPTMPMTSQSPPGEQQMRNLWTLSDTAARQGKVNQMNELLVAASLFSPPPGHPHPLGPAAAHHIAAAAAAANSTSGANAFNPAMFSQFGHHLAALGGANKMPPGMFDAHMMAAALQAHHHNAQAAAAAAAGMRMHHPFAGSMSPPLNIPNYFPHGATAGQQSPSAAAASANLQKSGNSPSGNKSGSSGGTGKSNVNPFAPLFSHSVPVSSPKSPNSLNPNGKNNGGPSASAMKSPTMPSHNIGNISSPMHPFTPGSSLSNNPTTNHHPHSHHHHHDSGIKDQKASSSSSVSGKSGTNSHYHNSHDSSTHGTGKTTKINGIMSSTPLPVFPPGIHNPLLPSSRNNSNSNSSGNSSQSGNSSAASAVNKTFPAPALNKNPSKGGIPNSMKISNFLPNKPKDSQSDANAEAKITSGFGIPPLQSKPNFSLSPSRASSVTDTLSLNNAINTPKSSSLKEGPLSPVKSIIGGGASLTNKPSSLTCASLLLPDSLYTKPSSHHFLNSLSPTKPGEQGNLGLSSSRSNRTPSSDSVLLSPNSSSSSTHNKKSSSPGLSSSTFNKPGIDLPKQARTLSPTKEISIKKEKGGIPMGGSGNITRNFTSPTTEISPQNTQCLSSLTRPIPTMPAFFNRSTAGNNTTASAMSSNINHHQSPHHHQHSHHHHAPIKDGIPHNKTTSPGRKSISPVKISNEQQQQRLHQPHLASPGFPFPGVSVPVQVKLHDDNETVNIPLPAVVTSASSIINPIIPPAPITLKSEVNKLKEKEEKVVEENNRKRPCSSSPILQHHSASTSPSSNNDSKNISPKFSHHHHQPESKMGRENSSEMPPTKVQKLEVNALVFPTVENGLEKQETEQNSPGKKCIVNSESEQKNSGKDSGNNAGGIGNESRSSSLQMEKGKEGEQQQEKSKVESVVKADPSKDFYISTKSSSSSGNNTATLSSDIKTCKVETESLLLGKVEGSGEKVVKTETLSEEQTEKEMKKSNIISVEMEKSETQIVVDKVNQKSNEATIPVSHQESKGLNFPEELKNEEIRDNELVDVEKKEEMGEDDIDVEAVNEHDVGLLGHCETANAKQITVKADEEDDNQMEIDVDFNQISNKMEGIQKNATEEPLIEERLVLTNEEEDVDVDIVDDDEPMEVNMEATPNGMEEDEETSERLDMEDCENSLKIVDTMNNEECESLSAANTDLVSNHEKLTEESLVELHQVSQNENEANQTENMETNVTSVDTTESEMNELEGETVTDLRNESTLHIKPDVTVENFMETASSTSAEPEKENEEDNNSTTFLSVNESTNFSQDDSEFGDLVIDLGPNEEEMEKEEEEKNSNLEEAEQDDNENESVGIISSSTKQAECNSEASKEFIREEERAVVNESLPQETGEPLTKDEDGMEVNEPSSTFPSINCVSDAVEEQTDEQCELNEKEKQHDYHESSLIQSSEESEEQVAQPLVEPEQQPQNPDSILNQITINPTSIEVNGVIKTDTREEKESKEMISLISASDAVAECPEPSVELLCANETEKEEVEAAKTMVEKPPVQVEKFLEENLSGHTEENKSSREENKSIQTNNIANDEQISHEIVDSKSSPLPKENVENISPIIVESSSTDAIYDEASASLLPDKTTNEDDNQAKDELTSESKEIEKNCNEESIDLNDNGISIMETTAPVRFLESDNNNIENPENISVSDVIMEKMSSSEAVVTGDEIQEETPMEIEEDEAEKAESLSSEEALMQPTVQGETNVDEDEAVSTLDITVVDEVDEVSMQIEHDSILPTVDSSTCVPAIVEEQAPAPTTTPTEIQSNNVNEQSFVEDSNSNEIELIPATSAETLTIEDLPDDDDHEDNDNTPTTPVTPTTSTSSVAIKLNISTSNDEGTGNDLNCGNIVESLLPSSITATTSSSLIIPPSSNNTSGSSTSSSSSSPVDVSPTSAAGLSKSLETFGKVAAGLLASATGTINNNNNNTSLAPTSCDAISIATTNANA